MENKKLVSVSKLYAEEIINEIQLRVHLKLDYLYFRLGQFKIKIFFNAIPCKKLPNIHPHGKNKLLESKKRILSWLVQKTFVDTNNWFC